MVLTHPYMFWLLIAIPALWWLQWRAHRGTWTGRNWLIVMLRTLSILLMVIALVRPVMPLGDTRETVVAVVDVSPSISHAALAQVANDIAALDQNKKNTEYRAVIVSDTAQVVPVHNLTDAQSLQEFQRRASERDAGSALADALMQASSLIPLNGSGRVVIYTDGLETRGDAALAAHRLADRGIMLDVHSIEPAGSVSAAVESIDVPASVGVWGTISGELRIDSKVAQRAVIQIKPPQGTATKVAAELKQGKNRISLPAVVRNKGLNVFNVDIDLPDQKEQLSSRFSVMGLSPLSIAVIETPGRQHASRALASLLGASAVVKSQSPADLQKSPIAADVVVLANVPATALEGSSQQNLRESVANGAGLLFTGGPESFGPGGYGQSALADLIPISLNQQQDKPDPSVALVVIIDTSASMAGARISLAKEVVRITMQRMSPHDKIGIVEFYGSKRWAAPIQSAANSLELNRALNRLTAGGGTLIYPALEEAFFSLKSVNARSKHVLILTDGGVETGPFEAISRQMADNGMTVSTVLTGPGQHSNFLASIAQWGRGHFYQVPDLFSIPEIQLKQPSSQIQSPFVDKPSRLVAAGKNAITSGIDFASAPVLNGYVRAGYKSTADTILQSSNGDPVLTSWRYGRGRVAAFTSSLGGEWMRAAQSWPDTATLFSNLMRSIAARPAGESLEVVPTRQADSLQISIRSLADSHSADALTVKLLDRDGKNVRQMVVDPIAASRWNLLIQDPGDGDFQISAESENGHMRGAAAITLLPRLEFASFESNASLLKQMESESLRAGAVRESMNVQPVQYRELWPVLAILSLICLVGNVLVRRLPPKKWIPTNVAHTQTQPKEQHV